MTDLGRLAAQVGAARVARERQAEGLGRKAVSDPLDVTASACRVCFYAWWPCLCGHIIVNTDPTIKRALARIDRAQRRQGRGT